MKRKKDCDRNFIKIFKVCLLSCRILKAVPPLTSNEAYQLRISNYIIFEVFGKKVLVGTLANSYDTIFDNIRVAVDKLSSSWNNGFLKISRCEHQAV